MKINGIAEYLVEKLVGRTMELSQGRNAGALGFVDEKCNVAAATEIVDGGLGGIPLRILLGKLFSMKNLSLLEGLQRLPENTVLVVTRPGKTGLITDVSGIDLFNFPIINIGVKNLGEAGISVIYPEEKHFNLATDAENITLATLTSNTMAEERQVLKSSHFLGLKYLELGEELEALAMPEYPPVQEVKLADWKINRYQIKSLDKSLADELVQTSREIGQGREVALMGRVDENGRVVPAGKVVTGGMGYVPSRLLASSAVNIENKSLRYLYSEEVDKSAVIVHTHPGGTGVMHIGDAMAGPGTWGRAIIAVGHDKDGKVRGATVIEASDRLFDLADEEEQLNMEFFDAESPEEESRIRNRKFGIAQDYTQLCKPLEIN